MEFYHYRYHTCYRYRAWALIGAQFSWEVAGFLTQTSQVKGVSISVVSKQNRHFDLEFIVTLLLTKQRDLSAIQVASFQS